MLPPRPLRLLSTGLLAAFATVPLAASPAAATTASCAPKAYAAESSADVVRLSMLDLRPLGVPVGPVAEVALATTRSTMDARRTVAARADARYAEGRLAGLKLSPLFLDSAVTQQAPPSHDKPAVYTGLTQDAGLARVGTGELSAHATWTDKMGCGMQTGPAGHSSAAVADLAVLPGSGSTALVRAPRNISSQAVTGLRSVGGKTASVAAAEIELADLRLLSGALAVKVLKAPKLTATSTGLARTSNVEYQAPVLEISGNGLPTQRLDSPSKHIDVALPASALALPGTDSAATAQRLPVLGGDPLGGLLRGLNVPELGSILGGATSGGLALPGPGSYAMLRISLGAATKTITDGRVTAEAASLRVQLLLCGPGRGQTTILDLGVGVLRASATAPCANESSSPSPSPSASTTSPSPAPSTPPVGCGGPGCGGPGSGGGGGLPLTGMAPVTYVVGAGVLLALAGRLLLLMARKRDA